MNRQDEARFLDIARACSRSGEPRFTRFLEPTALPLAERAAREQRVLLSTWGGYDGAERQMGAFHLAEDEPLSWPIVCVKLRWNEKYAAPSHRDLLGAVMAQGIERNCLGDIQLGASCAYLFATHGVADYLAANLLSAGRAPLKVEEIPLSEAEIAPPKGREVRATIPSMRLDCIVAEGFRLSRAEAQALIARGLVKLNHVEEQRADARVPVGGLVSARGHGRLSVLKELGETRKGRLAVLLFVYGD